MNFKFPIMVMTFLFLGQNLSRAEDKSEISSIDSPLQLTKNILGQMGVSRAIAWKQLESSRVRHNVVKSLCLNDKLNQIDVAIRSAYDRKSALQVAIERGDVAMAMHEFAIISILNQRTKQFISESSQCIGNDGGFVGEITIKSIIDPSIPTATFTAVDNDMIVQPPTCSSCFK